MKKNSTMASIENKSGKSNRANQTERKRVKEAKARRKVNDNWQRIECTGKYRKAVAKSIGINTTDKIADEVLDGILLNLNVRNCDKSVPKQKRLLRRIVEKRQAQAIHAKIRNNRDRKSTVAVIVNSSKCMERLHYLRFVG